MSLQELVVIGTSGNQGPAGAGKTQLMTEAVTAIEALSRKRVLVLAPSSASVEVLRTQGFTNAETLQQFQVNSNLQEQIKGQLVWVDEAGFLSVSMYSVLTLIHERFHTKAVTAFSTLIALARSWPSRNRTAKPPDPDNLLSGYRIPTCQHKPNPLTNQISGWF